MVCPRLSVLMRAASVSIALMLAPPCLATPTAMTVHSLTVAHDGRSIFIDAYANDPGVYGAVDWVPGWIAGDKAMLTVTRGYSITLVQMVFTGAILKIDHTVSPHQLHWSIWALIPDASHVVIPGDGLGADIDKGWLQDAAGNSLDAGGTITYANYSLVGTDGFIDESQFTFDNTLYVDLTDGMDAGSDEDNWSAGTAEISPGVPSRLLKN